MFNFLDTALGTYNDVNPAAGLGPVAPQAGWFQRNLGAPMEQATAQMQGKGGGALGGMGGALGLGLGGAMGMSGGGLAGLLGGLGGGKDSGSAPKWLQFNRPQGAVQSGIGNIELIKQIIGGL